MAYKPRMSAEVKALVVLVLLLGAGCGDDAGTPDSGIGGAGGSAGAAGVNSGGGGASAGTSGMTAGMTGGRSGGGALGTDVCARVPADSCDLLSGCESVKAQRDCAGPIMFVACAPKQSSCVRSASFCAKDANAIEWYFPTSCGKDLIQQGPWTIEAQCGCSEPDAGAEDAGL
jgi:hypothetical protein